MKMELAIACLLSASFLPAVLAVSPEEKEAILAGIKRASVIVVGTTHSSTMGGGGTTTGFRISDTLVGQSFIKERKDIVVFHWHHGRGGAQGISPGPFIWFLQPHGDSDAFKELTSSKYSFVKSTPENIAFVKQNLPTTK